MADGKTPDPKLAIAQAAIALALLIGLPFIYEPETHSELLYTGFAALVLLAFLVEGVARFLRSRRPRFHDSIMPPKEPPTK